MASVFKRGGKKNRHGHYTASYFNEHGKRVTLTTGTADREVAEQIAAKWETDTALRKSGIITAPQARHAEHNQRHIKDHVAEYLTHCEHIGQNRVHIANKKTQLAKLIEGIGGTRLSDIEPHKVERYLAGLVAAGLSHRTHNQHRATAISFVQWLVDHSRLPSNPLSIVPTLNEAKDRRRVRRALTDDELSRLIDRAGERRAYYLFAYFTGLRVKAVMAAVWGDVDFDAATIRVRVGNAKGKKDDTFYNLHDSLLGELKAIKPAFATGNDRIFRKVPTVRTFHRDCERAGIDRYDGEGRQLDRHALRTTLGTHLALAGVLPQQAMRVMGHSDVRITMKHYTALRLSDTAKAIQALTPIQAPVPAAAEPASLPATGTDDSTAEKRFDKRQQICQQSGDSTGQEAARAVAVQTQENRGVNDCRATHNLMFSQQLGSAGHCLSPSVLLNSPMVDNIENSRAIGAVG